jgi:hypothetical protein
MNRILALPDSEKSAVFRSGTSPSKAYQAIQHFFEDIAKLGCASSALI